MTHVNVLPSVRRSYYHLVNQEHRFFIGEKPGDPLSYSLQEYEDFVLSSFGKCYHCLRNLGLSNFSPDHIKALSEKGSSDLSNLRIICWTCNNQKKHMDDAKFHFLKSPSRLKRIRAALLAE